MTSQTGKQIIRIYILPNISRSKSNQIIEYKITSLFLGNSYTTCSRETGLRPFLKRSKLSISLDQRSEYFYILFLLFVQVKRFQNILKLRCWPLAFTLYKAFLWNKKKSGTRLSVSFLAWFLKKTISHVIFY